MSGLVAAQRPQRGKNGGGDGDPGNEAVALAVLGAMRGMLDRMIVGAMYVKVSAGHIDSPRFSGS
jgi:hypothetical protein